MILSIKYLLAYLYFKNKIKQKVDNDKNIDPDQPSKLEDEIIIEAGFNLYILINILLNSYNKNNLDQDQQEIYDYIKEYTTE